MCGLVDNGELFGPEGGNVCLARPTGWTPEQWARMPMAFKAELLAFCMKVVNDFFERGIGSRNYPLAKASEITRFSGPA